MGIGPLSESEKATIRTMFSAGISGTQIARSMGRGSAAVCRYLRQCGLQHKNINYCLSLPMEQALTPGQCAFMREFLRDLVWAYSMARRAGKKPNITRFINEYRMVKGVSQWHG